MRTFSIRVARRQVTLYLSIVLTACGSGGTDTPFDPANNTGNPPVPSGGDTRAIVGFWDASKLDGDFESSRYFLFGAAGSAVDYSLINNCFAQFRTTISPGSTNRYSIYGSDLIMFVAGGDTLIYQDPSTGPDAPVFHFPRVVGLMPQDLPLCVSR